MKKNRTLFSVIGYFYCPTAGFPPIDSERGFDDEIVELLSVDHGSCREGDTEQRMLMRRHLMPDAISELFSTRRITIASFD